MSVKELSPGRYCKEMPVSVSQVSDRVLCFIGSDETPDRGGDVVTIEGWKLDNYLKNPVVLWAHNSTMPPVGKAVQVVVDKREKKLKFHVKFPTIEELSSDPKNPSEHALFVDTVYNLYKGGYLSATSVGFAGKGKQIDGTWGIKFDEQELFELSLVPIPANPNALVSAKNAGINVDCYTKGLTMETREKAGARLSKVSRERLAKLRDELSAFLDEDQTDDTEEMAAPNGGIEQGGEGGIEKPKGCDTEPKAADVATQKAVDDFVDLGNMSLDILKNLR